MARIIDKNFSERLAAIAGDVNFACFAGHQQAALNSMIELYNTADKYESKRLLRLDSNHAQSIGLAYMWFAIAVSIVVPIRFNCFSNSF